MNTRMILLLSLILSPCAPLASSPARAEGEVAAAAEFERGPHRGRLLRDGDFALEVTIFETGVPPQFRLYAYRAGQAIAPDEVRAAVVLTRLGGKVDRFAFAAENDYLVGDGTVNEPHSFDVIVTATHAGREHRWQYPSYEGRTVIAAASAKAAGVGTSIAGPATIVEHARLMGVVRVDEQRQSRVRARFPGLLREVRTRLGEAVVAGQVLATVESNESLRAFTVTAPIAGIVTRRRANAGEVAGEGDDLFEITDLSEVWVDLHAFGDTAHRLAPGQATTLRAAASDDVAEATIDAILPLAAVHSQSTVARVRLANREGRWRPGLAVSADVVVASREVPLAVKTSGLQRFRDFTVVFANVNETYEVRMLELGARDDQWVEVLGGLDPGTRYVSEQSFLIKADVEKSGASHDH